MWSTQARSRRRICRRLGVRRRLVPRRRSLGRVVGGIGRRVPGHRRDPQRFVGVRTGCLGVLPGFGDQLLHRSHVAGLLVVALSGLEARRGQEIGDVRGGAGEGDLPRSLDLGAARVHDAVDLEPFVRGAGRVLAGEQELVQIGGSACQSLSAADFTVGPAVLRIW
jgi:hypothetical protein